MKHSRYEWCYEKLGVRRSVEWPDLRLAYRRKLHACHPDLQTAHDAPTADDEFKEVVQAFRLLAHYYNLHGQLPDPAAPLAEVPRGPITVRADASAELDLRRPFREEPYTQKRYAPIPRSVRFAVAGFVLTVTTVAAANYVAQRNAVSSNESRENGQQLDAGMAPDEVLQIQGVPTLTRGSVWFYGSSGVIFDRGCVSGWENAPPFPLRTQVSAYSEKEDDEPEGRDC